MVNGVCHSFAPRSLPSALTHSLLQLPSTPTITSSTQPRTTWSTIAITTSIRQSTRTLVESINSGFALRSRLPFFFRAEVFVPRRSTSALSTTNASTYNSTTNFAMYGIEYTPVSTLSEAELLLFAADPLPSLQTYLKGAGTGKITWLQEQEEMWMVSRRL